MQDDSTHEAGNFFIVFNPTVAGAFATQEKGLGHFLIIYGQSLALMMGSKKITKQSDLKIYRRPSSNGQKSKNGMPSCHTMKTWPSAAYARTFFTEYQWVAIPLYATSVVTAYSRVKAKRHTVLQVAVGAELSEGIVYLNDVIGWSDCYTGFDIDIGDKECCFNFKIKF